MELMSEIHRRFDAVQWATADRETRRNALTARSDSVIAKYLHRAHGAF